MCDDRSEHPLDRTVREGRRRDRGNSMHRQAAVAERLRTRLPGGGTGHARLPLRGPLAALREQALVGHVSVSAPAGGLQQAPPRSASADQAHDPGTRDGHRLLDGHSVDHRFHSSPVRDITTNRPAVGLGRLGQLRLLRVALPLLLGPSVVPGLYSDRNADHVGPGQPEDRRTRGPRRHAGGRRRAGRRPRASF